MRGRTFMALGSGLVVAATVGLAVSMTLIMDQLKFEQKLADLLRSRLEVLVEEVREQAEFGLTLGLALSELVALQTQIDRDIAGDARLLTLVIHDETGQPLFAAGRAKPPPAADLSSTAVQRAGGIWAREEGATLAMGTRLVGGFGEAVGGVMLRYSLTEAQERRSMVLTALALRAVTVIAVAAVVALLGVTMLVRRLVLRYGPLVQTLAEAPLTAAGAVVEALDAGENAQDLADILRVARGISAAARELETAESLAARIEAGGRNGGMAAEARG